MRQQRVHKARRVTDKRSSQRDDEPQEERPEVREDIRRIWFEER